MKYEVFNVVDGKFYLKNDSGTILIVSEKVLKTHFWKLDVGVYLEK